MNALAFLSLLLTGLRANLARIAPRAPAPTPAFGHDEDYISRAFASLEHLFTLWRNGALPSAGELRPSPGADASRPSLSADESRPSPAAPTPEPHPASPQIRHIRTARPRPPADDHATGTPNQSPKIPANTPNLPTPPAVTPQPSRPPSPRAQPLTITPQPTPIPTLAPNPRRHHRQTAPPPRTTRRA